MTLWLFSDHFDASFPSLSSSRFCKAGIFWGSLDDHPKNGRVELVIVMYTTYVYIHVYIYI